MAKYIYFSKLIILLNFIIAALLLFFIFPIITLISQPIFIFRYVIVKSSKLFGQDLAEMLTARSTFFALDDIYNRPQLNIVIALKIKGTIDINNIREVFSRKVLKAQLPNGKIRYPELQQYLKSWMGFLFWKNCTLFDIKNQVKQYQDLDRHSDKDLNEIFQELVTKKWNKLEPLWELIAVSNCNTDGTKDDNPHITIMLRFHHCVGDGYSWTKLLTDVLDDENKAERKLVQPRKINRNIFLTFFFVISFPFRAAYEIAELLTFFVKDIPWKVEAQKKTGDFYINITKRIPISKIKEIKNHFGVTFSSVIFAVTSGASRDLLIKQGHPVPQTILSTTALPLPGHPKTLRNHLTAAMFKLPIGEPDPIKRLNLCCKEYERVKRSTIPFVFKYYVLLAGSYFYTISRVAFKNNGVSMGVTSIPGPVKHAFFDGKPYVDIMFTVGNGGGTTGVVFTVLSYFDGIRFSPIVHSAVMTKKEVAELTILLEKHIDILYQLISV